MVGFDDRPRDRQAQARAPGLAVAGAVGAREPLEELRGDGRVDPRAVIVHAQDRVVAFARDRDRDLGSGGGVGAGVGEEVRHDLIQPGRIAGQFDGLVVDLDGPGVIGSGGACVADRLDCEACEVDRAVDELLPLVQTRQE